VLYPGKGNGPQTIGFERLQPGRRYAVEGAQGGSVTADDKGRGMFTVDLQGRTALHLVPTM
jgi:hypothetical protein